VAGPNHYRQKWHSSKNGFLDSFTYLGSLTVDGISMNDIYGNSFISDYDLC
jgi:hypothetical protein